MLFLFTSGISKKFVISLDLFQEFHSIWSGFLTLKKFECKHPICHETWMETCWKDSGFFFPFSW